MQSIYLLNPLSEQAKAWIDDHICEDHQTYEAVSSSSTAMLMTFIMV